MTDKTDFKKTLDAYRAERGRFRIVDVPDMQYLMIDGHGDPNTSPAFTEAVEALYPVAYKLKFASKRDLGRDYVVPPLEGLWWAEDMDSFTAARDKSRWDWTLMIMMPDWIDRGHVRRRRRAGRGRRTGRRVSTTSGWSRCPRGGACRRCTSAPSTTRPTCSRGCTTSSSRATGLRMVGKHHEIYLSDFRKVAPEKRRTILRQPVADAAPPGA